MNSWCALWNLETQQPNKAANERDLAQNDGMKCLGWTSVSRENGPCWRSLVLAYRFAWLMRRPFFMALFGFAHGQQLNWLRRHWPKLMSWKRQVSRC